MTTGSESAGVVKKLGFSDLAVNHRVQTRLCHPRSLASRGPFFASAVHAHLARELITIDERVPAACAVNRRGLLKLFALLEQRGLAFSDSRTIGLRHWFDVSGVVGIQGAHGLRSLAVLAQVHKLFGDLLCLILRFG